MNSRSIQTVTLGIALLAAGCAKLQPNAENQLQTDSAQVDSAPVILGTVATPVFSPGAGVYAATQNVSLTSTTTGTTICYATNPVQPLCNATKTGCATGTVYSATITVSTTQIINAIGCKANHDDSTIASASYTIDTAAPSVPTGFGGTPISTSQINLNWTASTDAVTPQANLTYEICRTTTSGGCSTFAITHTSSTGATAYSATGLAANTTYYFVLRAKDALGNASAGTAQVTATTTAAGTVNTPTFSPAAGTYGATQNVAISSTTGSATICYTTTGTTPACDAPKTGCATGTLYASSVSISSSQTLRAIGCRPGFTDSAVNAGAFVIDTTPPGNVTAFAATSGNGQISLSWTNPGAADFAGVKILRKIGSYPANSTDGTTVYNNTGTSLTDTGLTNGTQYYYTWFSYDTVGNHAAGVNASSIPAAIAAQWVRSISTGTAESQFASVAVDSIGNIYAVGSQLGTGTFTYGPGISVSGGSNGYNAVLTKYNASGSALWARSVSAASAATCNTQYFSLAIDSSDNIYAVGLQSGNNLCQYGSGVSVAGASSSENPVLVKYNSIGTALWARSITAGPGGALFSQVAVDNSGNIYAVGRQLGTFNYTYGSGVSIAGAGGLNNATLVKYNSSGGALWARSVLSTGPTGNSGFESIAINSAGVIHVSGYQRTTDSYSYGSGATLAGPLTVNRVLVKYNSSGSTTAAYNIADWLCAVDNLGNFYTARPTKYDSSGNSLWSAITDTGQAAALNSSGNVYAAGRLTTGTKTYGSGVTATGSGATSPVVIKYSSAGVALWARTTLTGSNAEFTRVTLDASGNIYAVGFQTGTASYTYASGVTVAGSHTGKNAVLVKYVE